ncbi:hypothetical protein BDN70DRAFT_475691 [Pholiota conissans]|uniref:Uncharacterized protein n=1 Tax=Pholiota conissans TaxID=109636 RepID=A0A9P5YPU9_9AGAR|nr:hypothetical protein BDN70DRAFT_475691 [Pholiota conissans]
MPVHVRCAGSRRPAPKGVYICRVRKRSKVRGRASYHLPIVLKRLTISCDALNRLWDGMGDIVKGKGGYRKTDRNTYIHAVARSNENTLLTSTTYIRTTSEYRDKLSQVNVVRKNNTTHDVMSLLKHSPSTTSSNRSTPLALGKRIAVALSFPFLSFPSHNIIDHEDKTTTSTEIQIHAIQIQETQRQSSRRPHTDSDTSIHTNTPTHTHRDHT